MEKTKGLWEFFFLLTFLSNTLLTAQLNHRADPVISYSETYDQGDGMITNCLKESFMDSKGRLWLTPCDDTASGFDFSFFQYDGCESHFFDIIPPWMETNEDAPIWTLLGESEDHFLYGSDVNFSLLFNWHPDTREQFFYQLNSSEQLLNMTAHPEEGTVFLTEIGNTYKVYSWINNDVRLLASIPIKFKDDHHYRSPFPLETTKDYILFFHQNQGLVRIGINDGFTEYFTWENLHGTTKISEPMLNWGNRYHWDMVNIDDEEIMLFLGDENGFFTLEVSTNTLKPLDRLNRKIKSHKDAKFFKSYFAKDAMDNILVTWAYIDSFTSVTTTEELNFQAWLMDYKGNWNDYSQILIDNDLVPDMEILDHPHKFISADFRYKMGWGGFNGLTFLEFLPPMDIKQFPFNTGMRGIVPLSNNQIIINSDFEFPYLVDLNKPTNTYSSLDIDTRPLTSMYMLDEALWTIDMKGRITEYHMIKKESRTYNTGVVSDKFLFLNLDEILLFSLKGEVYKYSLSKNETEPFLINDEPLILGKNVNDFLWVDDNVLWVGAINGLWEIDFSVMGAKKIDYPEILLNTNVLCLNQDSNGDVWLGTGNNGIIILHPENKSYRSITTAQGLSNNTVVALIQDDYMNTWASTFDGITVFNKHGKSLFEIGVLEGLLDYEFNRTSFGKLPNGSLIFGGLKGFVVIDPLQLIEAQEDKVSKVIYLTDLKYFDPTTNEEIEQVGTYNSKKPLQIPANHRYINLDFALSEYINLDDHKYSYRLVPKGASQKEIDRITWIALGSESKVLINNLPVGRFTIQIMGVDHQSNYASTILEIPIEVNDYFYRTWWFLTLVLCLASILIGLWVKRLLTQRKRLEREVLKRTHKIRKDKETIEKQALKLKELDTAKTRFFTNISHEFRTPLTVIKGLANRITESSEVKEIIGRNVDHILYLVNDILELRKLESGLISAHYQQGDIVKYMKYIVESFYSLAEKKDISLHFESRQPELYLDYDPDKMLKILSNLLMNALKFTKANGQVTLSLDIQIIHHELFYRISVSDTGDGIPQEKLVHIFDRFYQVDDQLSRTGSGTGIGLTLVKELVELMDGNITVKSQIGQGSQFVVVLPIKNQMETLPQNAVNIPKHQLIEPITADVKSIDEDPTKGYLPLLLIVEDNSDVSHYLKICLEKRFRLVFAKDGEEGLSKAIDMVPDIILSDVMMPKLDGLAMCKILKTDIRTSHIPIILLTAKGDLDSKLLGLEHGADVYLTKPFNENELQVRLKALLDLRQKLQERFMHFENFSSSGDNGFPQEECFMAQIKQIILEHMAKDGFGVPQLGELVGMSRTQLHNKLKSLTGNSTSQVIRSVRIERAKQLLVETELNVGQISSEIGIDSISYFSRIFREDVGFNPNKFRLNMVQNNGSNI